MLEDTATGVAEQGGQALAWNTDVIGVLGLCLVLGLGPAGSPLGLRRGGAVLEPGGVERAAPRRVRPQRARPRGLLGQVVARVVVVRLGVGQGHGVLALSTRPPEAAPEARAGPA